MPILAVQSNLELSRVSLRVFLLVPPSSAALICSWSVDGHPSLTLRYNILAQIFDLLTLSLPHTQWGI